MRRHAQGVAGHDKPKRDVLTPSERGLRMADVFISYKREDRARVAPLAQALEASGYTVWWDLELVAGQKWGKKIKAELDGARCVIVAWTANSVAEDQTYVSEWVENEADSGHRRGVLLPALFDPGRVAWTHQKVQFADLIGWDGDLSHPGFADLIAGVTHHVGARMRPEEMELAAWRAAERAETADAFRSFLAAHPQSRFAEIAKGRVTELDEVASWQALGAAPTVTMLAGFLRRWPHGRFADEAEARIRALELAAAARPAEPVTTPNPPRTMADAAPQRQFKPSVRAVALGVALIAAVGLLLLVSNQNQGGSFDDEPVTFAAAPEKAPFDAAAEAAGPSRAAPPEGFSVDAARRALAGDGAAISSAFVWSTSPQGHSFWSREQAQVRAGGVLSPEARAQLEAWVQAAGGGYDVEALHPDVRRAALAARDAAARGEQAAARAREAATLAEAAAARARRGEAGTNVYDYGDGRRYEGEWANGTREGYGVFSVSAPMPSAGDRSMGQFRGGERAGLGVYTFAENANNTAQALRYEGEWAGDRHNGVGVYHWREARHAGGQRDGRLFGPGVLTFSSGMRYEGEYANGQRSGYGVLWTPDGQVSLAGIWQNDQLATALAP